MDQTDLFYRNLPHWHPANATFFITFRLAGSLPQEVLEALQNEKEQAEKQLTQTFSGERLQTERYNLFKKMFARYDEHLAQSNHPRWLADPSIAEIVRREIHALHPEHYRLICYCIMPNHVHLLVDMHNIPEPLPLKPGQRYTAISHVMKLLKGRTGFVCRKLLGGSGAFWQHESYDHVVRNQREYENIIAYILNNPVKAGLVERWDDWAYSFLETA